MTRMRGMLPGELDSSRVGVGPLTSPPWAHDHRVGPRMLLGWTLGSDPTTHVARYGARPSILLDVTAAERWTNRDSDQTTRPMASSEAVVWLDSVRSYTLATPQPLALAWEVAELVCPVYGATIVEVVATYLHAQALDGAGEPTGAPFVTSAGSDPFALPLPHPNGGELAITWALVGVGEHSGRALAGDPAEWVPAESSIQVDPRWSDLRFAWGSDYSRQLRLVVPRSGRRVRLYAIVRPTSASWAVRVGGRLSGFAVPGGPRRAALDAVVHRWT